MGSVKVAKFLENAIQDWAHFIHSIFTVGRTTLIVDGMEITPNEFESVPGHGSREDGSG